MVNEKIKWNLLLLSAITLFLFALITGNILFNIISIIIAIVVYIRGDNIIFADYNKKKREKQEKQVLMKKATNEILSSKILKKSKGGDK